MSPMQSIVKMKPYCRHCGTQVPRLHRCPKCGKRNWMILTSPPGASN